MDIAHLGGTLVSEVDRILNVERVGILLLKDDNHLSLVAHKNLDSLTQVSFPDNKAACDFAKRLPIALPERVDSLAQVEAGEPELLQRWGVSLIIPMRDKRSQLLGLLVLGRKQSDAKFSGEDIDLLSNAVANAGLAVEGFNLQRALIVKDAEVEKMKEINRLKSEFLSFVSHDLRTPLTSIRVFAELLQTQHQLRAEQTDKYLRNIIGESDRLKRMVSTLLDAQMIESGVKQYRFDLVDLCGVVDEVLSIMSYQLEKQGFRISRNIPAHAVLVNGDRDAIIEAFINVISNSISFSAAVKQIDVSVAQDDTVCWCSFADRGIGMRKEDLPRIFETFYRSEGSNRHEIGSGIGLSVVKHIVDAHGGKIEGRYVVTFEIKFINTAGVQYITRQKEQEIVVAPLPTAVYADQNNNKLFFFLGADNVYNKPSFLVEGFDPDNGNTPEINYSLGFDLIEEARAQGYDIFIMEFANGGVDLTANRGVFLGACILLHTLLGSTEAAIQVVGISMGGTIARYGLAWAEDNGSNAHPGQYIEHYVNTFISFDSPQQGAHTNTGLQTFIMNHGNSTQQGVLQSVAAKQMLYENVYGSQHSALYTTLRSLHNNDELGYGYTNGYPRRCVNFSVSNGNHNAVYPNRTTNDVLARLRIHVNINANDVITLPVTQIDSNIYAQPRDLWAGSTFTHDLTTLFAYGSQRLNRYYWGPIWVDAYGTWRFQVNFNPSYTPTESSLDLEGYTRTAKGSLIGGTSWFNSTLEQVTPRRHEELTVESKTQVMSWLNSNRTYAYLGRPKNVSTQLQAGSAVNLYFQDEAAFEWGFKVERKIAGGSWSEIATLPANTATYTDPVSGLQSFQTYYYRVKSYSGSRSSPFSPEVAVFIQPHLASNNPQATGTTSQRKIVNTTVSGASVAHAVYESGGSIWYTRNAGSGWSNEFPISISSTAKNPSIGYSTTQSGGTPYIYVVWTDIDQNNPSHWLTYFKWSSFRFA